MPTNVSSFSLDTSSPHASDIQQDMWHLHYIGIEEFCSKICNLSPSSNKRNRNQETLLRVVNSFKGFLDKASGYFHALIVKLRAKYGLPPSPLPGEALLCLKHQGSSHGAVSCHRLLIYLGDLARYKELFAVQNTSNHVWTVTANYYMQAATLCPSTGNAHNQLAVLATYTGDALGAIYHYCRSLAVDVPFVTARENLTLLFEKVSRKHGFNLEEILLIDALFGMLCHWNSPFFAFSQDKLKNYNRTHIRK
ncbi:hypothetical protein KI387_002605, partial [Taxus chinensis]